MTHPTREEWMSYLYDELPSEERATLQTHLQTCAECHGQLAHWQTATKSLGEWKLPPRRSVAAYRVVIRCSTAAALLALGVIGGARLVALNSEVKQLRAELQSNMDSRFNAAAAQVLEQATKSAAAESQTLVTAVAQDLEGKRVADQQATLAALQKLATRHAQDYASLRKELETVAVFSEAGWQRAQSQISSLASVPANFSNEK